MITNYKIMKNPFGELSIYYNSFLIKNLIKIGIVKNHSNYINHIDFSKDGSQMLSSGDDDLICIYDLFSKKVTDYFFNKMYGTKNALFTDNNNEIIYSSKNDNRIIIMNYKDRQYKYFLYGLHSLSSILSMKLKSNFLLSEQIDSNILLWKVKEKKCYACFTESSCACFDYNGEVLCNVKLIENSSEIQLYDLETLSMIKSYQKIKGIIKQILISNDGMYIITLLNTSLYIFNSETGSIINIINRKVIGTFTSFDISPDSSFIAIADELGTVNFIDIQKKELVSKKEIHLGKCTDIRFNHVYALLAVSSDIVLLYEPNYDNRNVIDI